MSLYNKFLVSEGPHFSGTNTHMLSIYAVLIENFFKIPLI